MLQIPIIGFALEIETDPLLLKKVTVIYLQNRKLDIVKRE